ncbi:MAG: hypothetical protein J5621_06640 [Paludibacteraceae bacterium]|nr:hypothetical protein [Paludibacteraceae bacterium]
MKKFFAFVAAAMTALTINAEVLTVAQALERGMALDSLATDSIEVTVEGIVNNAGVFSLIYNNQNFYMLDSATAKQEFQAYQVTPMEGNDTVRVLDGDKVQLTGKLYKYYDKKNKKFIIEVNKGTAAVVEKVAGDHAIDRVVREVSFDSIMAVGKKLASGDVTPVLYKVTGFVTAMINDKNKTYTDGGFAKYKNQTLWIAGDSLSNDSTAEKAFEIYQGTGIANGDTVEMKKGDKVSIICQLKNYNGTIENNDTKLFVEVLNYVKEEIDTITVAQAAELALALGNNEVSEKTYAIIGYVKKVKTAYNKAYGNETFYMIDELGNSTLPDIQCYRAKIAEPGCEVGDKVLIVGKLKNNFYNNANSAYVNEGGEATIIEKGQGIENVVLTEKAQKVMVDGVVYVIRNNKMFDLMGNQVR